MIFWIIVGLIALTLVIGFIAGIRDGWFWSGGMGPAVGIAATLAIIGGCVCGIGDIASAEGGNMQLQHEWKLRALVTQTSTESGSSAVFFLGFGAASSGSSEVTSIAYIRMAEDGGSTLQRADISDSVIYEDGASDPRVEDWREFDHNNGIFWPWPVTYERLTTQHRFHIPEGSILQSYEVRP